MGSRFPDDVGIPTIDLAKIRFQHSGAASNGMCNRKVTHPKLERFLDAHSPSMVAMEACSTPLTVGA